MNSASLKEDALMPNPFKIIPKLKALMPLILLVLLFSACVGKEESADLTIAGSTTVQPIITKASEVYSEKNPDTSIGVQGGGSGTGIRMVAEGSIAIGASSRELSWEEKEKNPDLLIHPVAIDCIVIVVHPSNNITDLTLEEIRKIFSGEITNYREVGGPNRPIVLTEREDGSGTRSSFESLVMEGKEASDSALQKPASGAIRFTVSGNENAIGYLGLGYLDGSIKPLSVNDIEPTEENVKAGRYPLSRKLYLVTKGEPEGRAEDFISYVLSEEGQKIVNEEGFVSIT